MRNPMQSPARLSRARAAIAIIAAAIAAAFLLVGAGASGGVRTARAGGELPPVFASAAGGQSAPAAPAVVNTFVVNNTGDAADAAIADNVCDTDAALAGNQCSLRAAIQQANATANSPDGPDAISFAIPSSDANCVAATGVCTITPSPTLPDLAQPVVIDGYTQTGASANTLAVGSDAVVLVEVRGPQAAFVIAPAGGGSTVRGLAVSASSSAIFIDGASNVQIEGNRIGTNAAGTTAGNLTAGNVGITLNDDGAVSASGNLVGGALPSQRNVIGGVGTGISINRASAGAGTNSVVNNYFGTDAAGTVSLPGNGGGFNTYGIFLSGGSDITVSNNVIASASIGLFVNNVTTGAVRGNRIGTNAAGTAALGNGSGVYLAGPGPFTVGGTTAADRNVISGNSGSGVDINANGQIVQGNYIGTTADGLNPIPNAVGVKIGSRFFNGSTTSFGDCTIGASVSGGAGGNRIAYNTGAGPNIGGIFIYPGGTGNRFLSNSIYGNNNGFGSGLGIDLNYDGPTPNDALDPDGGANNAQNYPVISSVTNSGATTTVNGTLNSLPNTTFTLEFFSSPAPGSGGFGEGQTFLGEPAGGGSRTVTTDAQGDAAFSLTFNTVVAPPQVVTATATNTTTNDTSEFSRALTVAQTFTVNTVADTDDGSCDPLGTGAGNQDCTLRDAIAVTNALPARDTIAFNIPGPAGVKTISNTSFSYNSLTDPNGTIIDGYTQPTASANTLPVGTNAVLLIQITGMPNNPNSTQSSGFNLVSSNNLLRGLVVNGFSTQIFFTGTNNLVEGCYVGTNPAGTAASGGGSGILDGGNVPEGSDIARANSVGGPAPAQRNVIYNGIRLVTGGNFIRNNYVGTNAAGTAALSPGNAGGVALSGNGNFVGGASAGEGNVISGTAVGIGIGNNFSNGGSNNTVQGNLIGTDATGQSALPNTTAGLIISNSNNVVGGTAPGARNVISGNGLPAVPGPGLQLGGFSTFTGSAVVQGNLIGVSADGTTPLGNTGSGVLLIGASSSTIGAAAPGGAGANTIANNGFNTSPVPNSAGDGVHVEDTVVNFNGNRIAAVSNRILSNSIYNNARLGINLVGNDSGNGVTPNDTDDTDDAANRLQNFPVITSAAVTQAGATRVTGTFNSTPGRTFTVEIFASASADAAGAEGQTRLGSFSLTTDANGDAPAFDETFATGAGGQYLTATATDATTNDTSEFSGAALAPPPPADISGRVTLAASGAPLSGVTVTLTSNAVTVATMTTDADGNYSFADQPAGAYVVTPSRTNYSFAPPNRLVNLNGADATGQDFAATPTATPSAGGGAILISEFRLRGPVPADTPVPGNTAGERDEFIELYNNSNAEAAIGGFVLDFSDGFSVTLPAGAKIPARGHYLVANSDGYSLGAYAAPDHTYAGADVPDSTGVALLGAGGQILDAAGFAASPAPYREGAGLAAVTAPSEHSFVRKLTTGDPLDRGDNATDFLLVATDPAAVTGSTLGAPGPESFASPTQLNARLKATLIDPMCPGQTNIPVLACGRYRNPAGAGGTAGTLTVRRRFMNTTDLPVTRLRFRAVDITTATAGATPPGVAVLRVLTSAGEPLLFTTGGGTAQTEGLRLETPPTQAAGGGYNSSVAADSVQLATPLDPGESIDVNFLLAVDQAGAFRFFVNVEAVTGDAGKRPRPARARGKRL